jgi:signal transduction histidine kinase
VAVADGQALVEVYDDGGGGVDPALGSGLSGLADRVSALGGALEIESEAGEGSTIRARIPVRATGNGGARKPSAIPL